MPYYYFDSTALVKRYSMERGTQDRQQAHGEAGQGGDFADLVRDRILFSVL